jgi:hypothetical protein
MAVGGALERGEDAGGDVIGADRLHARVAPAREERHPCLARHVDRRGAERRRRQRGLRHRPLGERLGPLDPQRVLGDGAERAEEDEALHAGSLGGAQQPPGRQAVELLQPRGGLVAPRGREVHDRADAAQRVAERAGIGELAERDLDVHARRSEPARVADQAAHGVTARGEPRQQGRADPSGGAGEQEHRRGA